MLIFNFLKRTISKNKWTVSIGEDVEKPELWCLPRENVEMQTLWETSPQKVKDRISMQPSNSNCRYMPQITESKIQTHACTPLPALSTVAERCKNTNVHQQTNG